MHNRPFALSIVNGDIQTTEGKKRLDIGIVDGKITEIGSALSQKAVRTIDASGKLIFPGFIDAHTHMGIPILSTQSVDDFESGSIAAAHGGVTTIIDFTAQQPGQTLQASVQERMAKAEGKSHVDFGLHVNVTDQPEQRLHEISELTRQGFCAYKVFSTYRQAGMMITWPEFRLVLQTVHKHGGLLCLHAEDNAQIESQTNEHIKAGHLEPIYHPRSRTPEAEAEAITRAAEIAGELEARLYIVHLSSKAGLEAGLIAREQGVELILETCPQYLLLSEERYLQENGHYCITTPPLRTKDDQEALWQALADGKIDVVATDHCPFTMAQKESGRKAFHLTPNGIPGVETLFPLLYTYGVAKGRLSLKRLLQVLALNPAKLFGFSDTKGETKVGADADLIIFDPKPERSLRATDLHGNADWSPYEGFKLIGNIDFSILRGQILVEKGQFVGSDVFGRLL